MIYGVPLSQILSSLAIPFLFLLTCTYLMGVFTPRNKFPVAGKSILLTGASEGLGLEVAKLLASRGASLFVVARNPQKLEKALGEIEVCNPLAAFSGGGEESELMVDRHNASRYPNASPSSQQTSLSQHQPPRSSPPSRNGTMKTQPT